MKRISNKFYPIAYGIILVFLLFVPSNAKGCTAFIVKSHNQIFLAKNLDWEISNGIILINKKGVLKTAYNDNPKKLSWISKYGSVTFNQFGKEFPLGGMNEKGLVIEELNSWGETPKNDKKYEMNEFQWTQFCLDNFDNVEELIASIDSINIVPMFINLHYLISDSYGNIAIIEFYNGKTHIYHGEHLPYPILSNNHYENSLNYLNNFKSFGGDMKVRPENSSNERFVKVASRLKNRDQTYSKKENIFGILDYVSQKDTQWSIVYNIPKKLIHFKTSLNQTIKTIDLTNLDFSCKTPTSFLDIHEDEIDIDGNSFKKLEHNDNRKLLMDVFRQYQYYNLGEASKKVFLNLIDYGNSVKCK
jgi:choloylglycine hydrolase